MDLAHSCKIVVLGMGCYHHTGMSWLHSDYMWKPDNDAIIGQISITCSIVLSTMNHLFHLLKFFKYINNAYS